MAPSVKIYVGNIPSSARNSEMKELFEKFGKVVECDILKDYGFVHMEDTNDAKAAIAGLNDTLWKGSRVRVELSTTKTAKGKPAQRDRSANGGGGGFNNGNGGGPNGYNGNGGQNGYSQNGGGGRGNYPPMRGGGRPAPYHPYNGGGNNMDMGGPPMRQSRQNGGGGGPMRGGVDRFNGSSGPMRGGGGGNDRYMPPPQMQPDRRQMPYDMPYEGRGGGGGQRMPPPMSNGMGNGPMPPQRDNYRNGGDNYGRGDRNGGFNGNGPMHYPPGPPAHMGGGPMGGGPMPPMNYPSHHDDYYNRNGPPMPNGPPRYDDFRGGPPHHDNYGPGQSSSRSSGRFNNYK